MNLLYILFISIFDPDHHGMDGEILVQKLGQATNKMCNALIT